MCGICGEWYSDSDRQRVEPERIKRMSQTLHHRGPDGEGIYLDGAAGPILLPPNANGAYSRMRGRVGLGHRRLSIIDLATGSQPMANEDGTVWVVFNGEIYNFRSLRAQLETRGHRFTTQSDTEVLVHLYEDYGDDCVKWLRGMFAFALWDARRERLLLARDQVGIKPLFYSWDNGRLLFASELKALTAVTEDRPIDFQALHDYLSLNYIPGPRTIYRNMHKLQPGHILVGDKGGIRVSRYWDVPFGTEREVMGRAGEEELAEELRARLRQAVSDHLVSDVPLGVFLSGGLDSSTLVALMSEIGAGPIRTFSIGFQNPSYSETSDARLIAERFGTDHSELILDGKIGEIVPAVVGSFDEPFADSSAIPTYYVAHLARARVTVALGGDGGDEVLAGYHTYHATHLAQLYRRLPEVIRQRVVAPLVGRLPTSETKLGFDYMAKRFVRGAELPADRAHIAWREIFSEEGKAQLYAQGLGESVEDSFNNFGRHFGEREQAVLLDRMQYVDMKVYLPDDILVKVDRMSMAHSLEVRVPFLDLEVINFAAALPVKARLNGRVKKYLLRKAVADLLPAAIVKGRKRGFNVPLAAWMRRELREVAGDYLSPEVIGRQGWFKPEVVTNLIDQHNSGKVDHGRNLWALLVMSIWSRQQGLSC